jgi:triacylglycerol lipase
MSIQVQPLLQYLVLLLLLPIIKGVESDTTGDNRITKIDGLLSNNDYPVVLVHGFAGWGRNELKGFKYWGGIQGDLEKKLLAQGYRVLTATVGPFSSNWDRACELYAQIKGGRVDYGAKHSAYYKHERYGRIFQKGLFPEWGTKINGSTSNIQKIHLIGHSMGGQTSRMLAQLLANGGKGAPIEEDSKAYEAESLFAGGKTDWIHSITTISTPNQGTLAADGLSLIGETAKNAIAGFMSILGLRAKEDIVFDAKLDQWGLEARKPNEKLMEYLARVFQSEMFQPGFKDVCLWSLSTFGAIEENKWVKTLSNIYYFSFATQDTHASLNWKSEPIQVPNHKTMFLPLAPLGVFLGSRYGPNKGFQIEWQENDGAVNVQSMYSDGNAEKIEFNGISQIGKWNQMKILNHIDHLAVIGMTLHTQIENLYTRHLDLLRSLPYRSSYSMMNLSNGDNSTSSSKTIMNSLQDAIFAFSNAAGRIRTDKDLQELCATSTSNQYATSYCQQMLE